LGNTVTNKKVFIVENHDGNYNDINSCLPKGYVGKRCKKMNRNIEQYTSVEYVLCVSDILDIDSIAAGYALDSDEVFESLKRGVERISKLRQHLKCDLVMVTKIPARYLREHFENLKNTPNMQAIFFDDFENLCEELNDNQCLPYGTVYSNKEYRIHLSLKPYDGKEAVSDEDKTMWKKELSNLLREICGIG
jgi:hypothetical protein